MEVIKMGEKIRPLKFKIGVPFTKKFNGKTYEAFHSSYSKIAQEAEARKMKKAGALVRMVTSTYDGRKVYTLYTNWDRR